MAESTGGAPDAERIGSYRIEALLGRGGMGEVYLAYDERLQRKVAIKRIRNGSSSSGDAQQRARFRREAQAAARLSHPAVIQIYDILETEQGDCIVMEYVEGQTLARLIDQGALGLGEALRIASEIAEGLGEAHAKGLVHRDLKAENVIVTTAGRAKILDFGLARPLWDGNAAEAALTQSGAILGTAHAMSPEQASGRKVDHRSDLFSLGVLVYELTTGHSPFIGQNLLDTLRRVMLERPRPIASLHPEAPAALVSLVDGLLDKDPERRPQSARLVAGELARLAAEAPAGRARGAAPRLDPSAPTIAAPTPELGAAATVAAPLGGAPTAAPAEAEAPSPLGPTSPASPASPMLRVLLHAELPRPRALGEQLGETRAAEVQSRLDRRARDLLAEHSGFELDERGGLLLAFERCGDALAYALAYQQTLHSLGAELGVELGARIGIHLGEIHLRRAAAADVARGARALEVTGAATATVARIAALAAPRQTLLTRHAFELARQAAAGGVLNDPALGWLAHGAYRFSGLDEPLEIYEVGQHGLAPLVVPPGGERVRRTVALEEEATLGWRPAAGQAIPRRPHWQLVEPLGEGGFGEVWLAAHQATGERRVFKFCFDAARLRALQREVTLFRLLKEALGERDDIARILDWSFDVAPYFLEAEYTAGGSLVDWAERQGGLSAVSLATRLELGARIADALAAAHSIGVLHKDVKPANVLVVETRDGPPRIRLTDFGIGLLADQSQLAERGIPALGLTVDGDAAASARGGTLGYLAPELLAGKPATIQADLYALGVVLYQLVIGDLQRPLSPGWQRDIHDPLLAEDLASFVDGDVARRPSGAQEVAERLRRLDERRAAHEAAQAAGRALVRAQARRRIAWAVALTSSLMLVVVSVVAVFAIRARHREQLARTLAEQRRRQADRLIDFMLGDLRGKLEPIGRLAILKDVGDRVLEHFAGVPETELSPEELLQRSKAMSQIGQVRFGLGQLAEAGRAFGESLDVARRLAARDPSRGEWQFALGQSEFWVGFLAFQQKDLAAALSHMEAYLAVSQRLVVLDPRNADWQLELAYAHSNLGTIRQARGDATGATSALGASATIMETLRVQKPEDKALQRELAQVYAKLGGIRRAEGDMAGARKWFEQNVAVLAALYTKDGRNTELMRLLGFAHSHVGDILLFQGDTAGALAHYQADLQLGEQLVARDAANLTWRGELTLRYDKVGVAHRAGGDLAAAQTFFERGHALARELLARSPERSAWRLSLARSHLQLASVFVPSVFMPKGRAAEARQHLEASLALLSQLAAGTPGDAEVRFLWANVLWLRGWLEDRTGTPDAAHASWQSALLRLDEAVGEQRAPRTLELRARLLLGLGRRDEAQPVLSALAGMGFHGEEFTRLRALLEAPSRRPP